MGRAYSKYNSHGRFVVITENAGGVNIKVVEGEKEFGVTVRPEHFVEAVRDSMPGLTAEYERPIEVPRVLGTVVSGLSRTYVRARAHKSPWWCEPSDRGIAGYWADDEAVRETLRNGGTVL